MEYLIAAAIGIFIFCAILYAVIKHILSYPERKRLREEARAREAEIREILNGLDAKAEKEKTLKMLKENLPEGYRCGRKGCDGILLKQKSNFGGSYYVCNKCHNVRHSIRLTGKGREVAR
jgi:cbb3-type cytochrome oxidase subunit 3